MLLINKTHVIIQIQNIFHISLLHFELLPLEIISNTLINCRMRSETFCVWVLIYNSKFISRLSTKFNSSDAQEKYQLSCISTQSHAHWDRPTPRTPCNNFALALTTFEWWLMDSSEIFYFKFYPWMIWI